MGEREQELNYLSLLSMHSLWTTSTALLAGILAQIEKQLKLISPTSFSQFSNIQKEIIHT
jgi:hypothetical protein